MKEKIGILTEIFGEPRKSGAELLFFCPQCRHHKRKLSINLEKEVWKCWVCSFFGRNLTKLINFYGSFEQKRQWRSLSGEIDLETLWNARFLFKDNEKNEEQLEITLPLEFVSLCNKKLPYSALEPLRYLNDRGLTKQDILKWRLGYCADGEYGGRILVPSFNDYGVLTYFVARSYKNEIWPKYKNPVASKDIIFNEIDIISDKPLIITEGIFDAMKAENAIPLLGSEIKEESNIFRFILKHEAFVYLALDPDAKMKQLKICELLLEHDIQPFWVSLEGYKDLGEMTKEEVADYISKAKFISSSDDLISYRMDL